MRDVTGALRAIAVDERQKRIAAMSEQAIDKVRILEGVASQLPQVPILTKHDIHGSMYARTVFVPAGLLITGALIKIPTFLIVAGEASVYVDEDAAVELKGYNVLRAEAGRKQAFVARTDIYLTMIFPTDAKCVEDAEREFTDEVDKLSSRRDDQNLVTITGER